jgi:hypothetical protein
MAPLAAVMALLVPATAHASSFTPDPVPGAKTLQPDAAPTAAPATTPKPAKTVAPKVERAPVVRRSVAAPVVQRVVAPRTTSAPVVHRIPTKKAPPKRPAAKPKPEPMLVMPKLPAVLVPRFVEAPLGSDPPKALAALALGLAALTALSGAGLVFSWSRR